MDKSPWAAIAALECEQTRLAAALDQNSRTFVDCLHLAEASLHVQRRMLNDLLNGTLRTVDQGLEQRADFDSYFCEYLTCIALAAFAKRLGAAARPRDVPAAGENDDIVVFGGA